MLAVLSQAAVLQRELNSVLEHDMPEPRKINHSIQLMWLLLQAHLSIAPLRFPADCVSLTISEAYTSLLIFCRITVFSKLRTFLSAPNWQLSEDLGASTYLTNAISTLGVLQRCASGHDINYLDSFALLSALLQLLRCMLRSNPAEKKAELAEVQKTLADIARSPDGLCLTALCCWMDDDRQKAVTKCDAAVAAAQQMKNCNVGTISAAGTASLSLAYFVRAEVRRGTLARGDKSGNSFEWVDDLKRADKENPSSLRLSSLSLQAAVSPGLVPAKQVQAALVLLSVFDTLGLSSVAFGPRDAVATDIEWSAQLESMTSLFTYFHTPGELMNELGVLPEPVEVPSRIPIEQMVRDERFHKLRTLANRLSNDACDSEPFTVRDGLPADCHREQPVDVPMQQQVNVEPAVPRAAPPKLFRRYSTLTEAERLRTQSFRSFVYQRPPSGGSQTQREFPRWRSYSSQVL